MAQRGLAGVRMPSCLQLARSLLIIEIYERKANLLTNQAKKYVVCLASSASIYGLSMSRGIL